MIGVYINDRHAPFTDWILAGLKRYETRTKRTLSRFIGQRVAIIQTGIGRARIVGYATIDAETVYNDRPEQLTGDLAEILTNSMIKGTPFAWVNGKKVFYRLKNAEACKPYPVPGEAKKTRVYAQWEGMGK